MDVEGQRWRSPITAAPPQPVIITHTETPRALRGRGFASELVKGALDLIRADGRKVIAGCGFVVDICTSTRSLQILPHEIVRPKEKGPR